MSRLFVLAFGAMVLLVAGTAPAEVLRVNEAPPPPPRGTAVYPAHPIDTFGLMSNGAKIGLCVWFLKRRMSGNGASRREVEPPPRPSQFDGQGGSRPHF